MTATEPHISGLTEGEQGLQVFPKPDPGSWTAAFGLDTGPVDLADHHDPDFYEDEKEAVFRRSWLYVGRVESLPRNGTYFTRELGFLGVSVLVVRGSDGEIRAFHNVCSHRGNKLMWDDDPSAESSGNCREISCKYHGWRYGLDGGIDYVHNAPEFFDLKANDLALPSIHCGTWAGFVFVNLEDRPRQSLREFIGPDVGRLETFPFDAMTERYVVDCTVHCNWKMFIDAYTELYHVPYVHSKMNNPSAPATGTDKVPAMVPYFAQFGKHRMYSSGGPNANHKVRSGRPLDPVFRSSFYGPDTAPDVGPLGEGINPGRLEQWGLDNWQIYPNFTVQPWGLSWYMTYEHWPQGPDAHRFVMTMSFVPPETIRERLAQEHAALSIREFVVQDAGSCTVMQHSIRQGARDTFHLNDQEVLVRALIHNVVSDVEAYRSELRVAGNGEVR